MSDDGVRLHVKASDVSVSSSLVFFGNSVQYMCSSASYRIITKTPILGAQAQIYSHFSKYKSRCNFKYISENYIKIWLKVNIPILV